LWKVNEDRTGVDQIKFGFRKLICNLVELPYIQIGIIQCLEEFYFQVRCHHLSGCSYGLT